MYLFLSLGSDLLLAAGPGGFRVFRSLGTADLNPGAFLGMIRCDDAIWQQHGFPPVENRDGWGSRSVVRRRAGRV